MNMLKTVAVICFMQCKRADQDHWKSVSSVISAPRLMGMSSSRLELKYS